MNRETHQKVTAFHLKRNAYLYVRQSTMRQVFENTESTERQYALRQRAIALGWPQEQIIVIDSDLGQSGASAVDREGFQKLVAEVGMGRAGIVLGRFRHECLPQEQWQVLIRDAHPGYISWEEYERNQQRLQQASKAFGFQRNAGPPREGPALLQGKVICGLCGSRMNVHYNVRKNGMIPNYVCLGRGRLFGDPQCQGILGTGLDAAVGQLLVDTVTPVALDLALAVQQEITSRLDEADRLRHRHVERAEYEAGVARQRYMRVDPANRLVADALEADWNLKLRALTDAQQDYQRQRAADRFVVDEQERQRILTLATDFPAVWRDPKTPQRERKRMLALLIEDVTLIKQRELTAAVRFRGGVTTTLTLPRPLTPQQLRATHEDVRRHIDELMDQYTDAQVARILNERGSRTGVGDAFSTVSVKWVRHSAKIKSLKERLIEEGWLTVKQVTAKFGLTRDTLSKRRLQGQIKARLCNDHGQWLYWMQEPAAGSSNNTTNTSSTAGDAV